ncbi:MAG: vWA domain-containing protein [Planctomycetota bacterium]|jgi:Ca-activated chloride channel family protein
MKPKENNLETNIWLLVKLTGDADKPSEAFVDSVIEYALDELKAPDAERTRGGVGKSVRIKWLKKFAYAAAIFIACGFLLSALIMPALEPARELAKRSAWPQMVSLSDVLYPIDAPMAHGGTTPPNGEDVDAMFFKNYGVNPFVDTEDDHLSTFATDVDTGSYTIVRRYLHEGHLPPEKAVRVEEFVNYFNYRYAAPQEDTFAVYAEAAPWRFGTGRKNSYLLRLGLKGKQVSEESRKPAILTFVIDVSGSMNRENRLGLVKRSLRILVERLREEDRIGIAVYGSRGRKVMDHRGLYEKAEILAAIESLQAEGSTYAEEGIRIGYEMAENAYKRGYINRVILCSDGVANVGQTGADDILKIIREKAEKGITLSAVGFGMGNYNDVLLERLGDKGNGHYVYIDTIAEARRVFEDNLTGTLQVIGRDVKIQVDFNPEVVRSYRLIGYENRDVPDEKFRDDKYDGGEIGAGHSVTALYELKLWPGKEGIVATTYVRYKHADTSAVTEFKSHIAVEDFDRNLDGSSSEFKLAATVTEFAEILRKSYWAKGATLDRVLERAQQLSREFEDDAAVIELVDLISKAERLMKKVEVDIYEVEPLDSGEGEDEYLRR